MNGVVPNMSSEDVEMKIRTMFGQLHSIYLGVSFVHDLSQKTLDTIVSYGERLSAIIIASCIQGAKLYDSRKFIITEVSNGKVQLDSSLSYELVRKAFEDATDVSIVPGFIR